MQELNKEELDAFNVELKEVLKKHNVNLTVGHQIIVQKNPEEVEAPTTSETTGTTGTEEETPS